MEDDSDERLLEQLQSIGAFDEGVITLDGGEFGDDVSSFSDAEHIDANVFNHENIDVVPPVSTAASPTIGAADTTPMPPLPAELAAGTDPALTDNCTTALMIGEYRLKEKSNHQTKSMDSLHTTGFQQIFTRVFRIEGIVKNTRKTAEDADITEIRFSVTPRDLEIKKPTVYNRTGAARAVTPVEAHQRSISYELTIGVKAVDITLTAVLENGGTRVRKEVVENVNLTMFPCCVGSNACYTHNMTNEALKQMHEDPMMPKGYFILRGGMWSIEANENLTSNTLHVHRSAGHQNELTRATFISKPGDAFENSFQVIVKLLNDGQIVIELTLGKDDKVTIPFYLMYRAFGIVQDEKIADMIVNGVHNRDPVTAKLNSYIEAALKAKDKRFTPIENSNDPMEILVFISEVMKKAEDENAAKKNVNVQKYRVNRFLNVIDNIFFPHIGMTTADRVQKLKFLSYIIRKLLYVHADILSPTDRDGLQNKRVHPAGISLAKVLKTRYNLTIVQQIIRAFTTKIPTVSFSQINAKSIFEDAIRGDKLKEAIVQLMSPSKNAKDTGSRINPNNLYIKNNLNAVAAGNNVVAPKPPMGKSNDRAVEMRMTHPTHLGFYCISSSTDSGEQVGMNKQLAISASISGASPSGVLRDFIIEHGPIVRDPAPFEISRDRLAIVLVNGYPVGYVKNAYDFVQRYRKYRRHGEIDRRASIVWEVRTNEVSFWTDYGRMHRPLLIVYNNIAEYDAAAIAGKPIPFKQWIGLTREHIQMLIRGEITMADLENDGIIEYISPEEQLNAHIAFNISKLRSNESNVLYQYTHVDDERAIFGVTALAAVLAGMSNAVRTTMQTNQRKQAASWPATNFPYLAIKNTTVAHYVDKPLIGALTDELTIPSGQNVIVALMCHRGYNVEDSIDANMSSVDRGMFDVSQFNVQKAECQRDSEFRMPRESDTSNIHRDAKMTHIDEKHPYARRGSILRRGDVIVAKVGKASRGGPRPYSDQSIIHKKEETARVVNVFDGDNADNERIIKVKTCSHRPLRDGDKLSSRTGNKGIVAKLSPACDMPYTAEGVVVDAIVNCHSVPTRMALNQVAETALGISGAIDGALHDGTAMRKIDVRKLIEDLAGKNYKYAGHQRLYNGITGEPMDTMIFVGPCHYMRLEKFVLDEQYANNRSVTSALTFQPLQGKAADGGLRIGEMEKDTLCAQGATQVLKTKFHDDSDGVIQVICRNCKSPAISNAALGYYRCNRCRDQAKFVSVRMTRTALLAYYRIAGMGVRMEFDVETASPIY